MVSSSSVVVCILCNGKHMLQGCSKFIEKDVQCRWKFLKFKGLCFSCQRSGHVSSKCNKAVVCPKPGCALRHHHLLHVDRVESRDIGVEHNQVLSSEGVATRVGLGCVPVRLVGPTGSITTYALMDNGSDCTIIKANVANKLG